MKTRNLRISILLFLMVCSAEAQKLSYDSYIQRVKDNNVGYIAEKYNIDIAKTLCPSATCHFYLVPRTAVQVVVLWTAVGEQERLIHSLRIPFVVTGRTHMPS